MNAQTGCKLYIESDAIIASSRVLSKKAPLTYL